MNFNTDIFSVYNNEWAVVTAGDTMEDFNAMTISWGQMGTLWGKPVATVFVRDSRYTLDFMQKSEYFTLSWFEEAYRNDLMTLGRKSGRDTDKIAETQLHVIPKSPGVGFEEAKRTMVLKKIYAQQMDVNAMPQEIVDQLYATGGTHYMFIGEVVEMETK